MQFKKLVMAFALTSCLAPFVANSAGNADQGHGKITFTGSVIEAACSIDAASLDQTIQLGAIAKHQLEDGGKSTPVDFSIKLHDCDSSLAATGATVSFNGVAGDSEAGLDSAFATTGAATGVAVAITDLGGNIIKPNDKSAPFILNDGDNDLEFQAYVQGATSKDENSTSLVTAGKFSSVANFVMDYK